MPGSAFPGQFEQNERANSLPVHCYTFARGSQLWHYTDQRSDVTLAGVVYRAATIRHSEYARDEESASGELTIVTSDRTPLVADLNGKLGAALPIAVTIRQTHAAGVGGVTPTTAVRFSGVVKDRTIANGECRFTIASIAALLERPLLRWVCGPTCNKTVYGRECGVDPSTYTTTGCALGAISGRALTVSAAAAQAAGYYTAGYVVIETGPAAGERLFVQAHAGSTLTLLHDPPAGLTTAHTLAITAGCDGLESTCRTKFANIDHFGGFPRVPHVNPFTRAD